MEDPTVSEKKIDEIIGRCKKAMDVSYYKYGPARKNFAEGRVNAIKSIDLCLIKFNKTHNAEYLQDVINYALFRMYIFVRSVIILMIVMIVFFEGVGKNHGTCMLMKETRPDKWKLMCDGDKGKLFR